MSQNRSTVSLTFVNLELSKITFEYGALLTPITFAVASLTPANENVNTFGDATMSSTGVTASSESAIYFTSA